MKFKFPDSGKEITIEGYSSLTAAQVRGWYEANFPSKPVEPVDPLDTLEDGNVQSPKFKEQQAQYKKEKAKYEKELPEWSTRMRRAQWAGVKLYYASCVVDTNKEEVEKAVAKFAKLPPYIDLRDAIRTGYAELGVPFAEEYMDNYIYLFHICIANNGDQTLFENTLMLGTTPTQEAVESALFRLRGQV